MSRRPRILLVEDDEIDVEAIRRSFQQVGSNRELILANDGQAALAAMRRGLTRPYLLLVDLRMPRMGGLELLAAMRDDPALRDLCVFVLSTSNAERHRARAYQLGVAGYLVKSDDADRMTAMARMLDAYCELVILP